MKKKRRIAPKPKPRRNTYERSLDAAQERLEKAQSELVAYLLKVQALNQEIPYLQGIIQALTPPNGNPTPVQAAPLISDNVARFEHLPGVPDHLKRFIPTTPGLTLRTNAPAPFVEHRGDPASQDEFLSEPTGREMLE